MTAFDNQLAKLIFKNKMMDEVHNISSSICGFQSIHLPNAKNIRANLKSFIPTPDIEHKINEFLVNIKNYKIDISSPKSTFIKDLVDFLANFPCVQLHLPFPPDIDGIIIDPTKAWEKVLSLLKMPVQFLYMIEDFIFKSIADLINIDFPFPEFLIGLDLALLKFNAMLAKIPELLSKMDDLLECLLNTFIVDMNQVRAEVNACLNKVILTTTGTIDYTTFYNISDLSLENIKKIEYNARILFNDAQNEMAKAKGIFEENPLIFNTKDLIQVQGGI